MKLYKVLKSNLRSPFQNFQYEVGEKYICEDFDTNPDNFCSRGFYATDIEGLIYSFRQNRKVFEVDVSGEQVEIDQFQRRYEIIEILEECDLNIIKSTAKKEEEKLGYKLSEILFPYNPSHKRVEPNEEDIENLHKWIEIINSTKSAKESVRTSVFNYFVLDSIRSSVLDSIKYSILNYLSDYFINDSLRASTLMHVQSPALESYLNIIKDPNLYSVRTFVWNSVWDYIYAYISSLFLNIKKWNFFNHTEYENPFQSGIDLWKRNLIPIYDKKICRLYSGRKAEIVYEEKI